MASSIDHYTEIKVAAMPYYALHDVGAPLNELEPTY